MNELLGSDEICTAAHPSIMAAGCIRPRHVNVDVGFEGTPCWVNELIFEPLELETERPRFFGTQYIRLLFYYRIVPFIYESGAILGRARKNNVNLLEKLLGIPSVIPYEKEGDVISAAQKAASIRLSEFNTRHAREPSSFDEFLWHFAIEAMEIDKKGRRKKIGKKIPVSRAIIYLRTLVLEGVGFGSKFPELTNRMYRNYYENIDMDKWEESRAKGANIPERPTLISLNKVEDALLMKITITALDSYPDVIEQLDLTTYSKSFQEYISSEKFLIEWHERYCQPYDRWFEMYQCLIGSKP